MQEINTSVSEDSYELKTYSNNGKDYLQFNFRDKFTTYASKSATEEWSNHLKRFSNKRFIHIWNCQGMSGFDNAAKNNWLDHLKKYNDQTEKIILVSDNIIIRGAARLMSRFSNLDLTVYKNLEEMEREEMA